MTRLRRVLVVDDDPAIVRIYTEILETEGYAVDSANDGAVALEHVRRTEPDAIVLDLMTPVGRGVAARDMPLWLPRISRAGGQQARQRACF